MAETEETMLDSPAVTQDEKLMAMLSHLLGIPTSFIGPLIIYLIKKDSSKFVAFHSMQALIFQLALWVALVISGWLWMLVIGMILTPVIGIAGLVLAIIAAVKSYNGEWYEYPLVGRWARQVGGV
jgi:uncharacterized Tic20 family protein